MREGGDSDKAAPWSLAEVVQDVNDSTNHSAASPISHSTYLRSAPIKRPFQSRGNRKCRPALVKVAGDCIDRLPHGRVTNRVDAAVATPVVESFPASKEILF